MTEMWRFDTANFAIVWEASDCYDLDLSWMDDTADVAQKLASGEYQAFDSRVAVHFRGARIGEAHLGESIYANVADFRDHVGMNKAGHGSYFSDMVREAIADARRFMRGTPALRVT